jgi:hypothetical protein
MRATALFLALAVGLIAITVSGCSSEKKDAAEFATIGNKLAAASGGSETVTLPDTDGPDVELRTRTESGPVDTSTPLFPSRRPESSHPRATQVKAGTTPRAQTKPKAWMKKPGMASSQAQLPVVPGLPEPGAVPE